VSKAAAKGARKNVEQARKPAPARTAMSREAHVAYVEVQRCVRQLDKSVSEIQRGLRRAERQLEADASARIRELRKDAHVPLRALKVKQREAAATLKRVSNAASGTWGDITHMVETFVAEAKATATAAVDRFRAAVAG
jgi:hypothetical protein